MRAEVDKPRNLLRRRVLWLTAAGLILIVGLLVWAGARSTSAQTEANEDDTLATAEVVRTDLQQTTTYDGALGRVEGDPVTTPVPGTVTTATPAGSSVAEGDILYGIDDTPTVLLQGETPAYRPIAPSDAAASIETRSTGTVTWAPEAGTLIEAGDVLFEVDGRPVVLMYGDIPAWRDMPSWVSDGLDVEQLEENLVDLGYDPDGTVTIDEDFTAATRSMVRRWQDALGHDDTGNVDLGDVVFLSGPLEVRDVLAPVGSAVSPGSAIVETGNGVAIDGNDVAQLEAALERLGYAEGSGMVVDGVYDPGTYEAITAWQEDIGAPVDGIVDLGEVVFFSGEVQISDDLVSVGTRVPEGTQILATTGTDTVVTVELPTADQGLVGPGDEVVVTLPNRTEVTATVSSVAETATVSDEGEAVFEMIILLDNPSDAVGFVDAPVDVDVVSSEMNDVLAVPVTALLVLAEGGYAVEVVVGSQVDLLAVEPGFFADGMVEVNAEGLHAGDLVVIP